MIRCGIGLHCHHDVLVEVVWDYDKRVQFIQENKLEGEIPLRLRLFQLIPEDRLPAELVAAMAEGKRLWAEGKRLWAEGDRLWAEGNRISDKGNRFWVESNRLWAEGNRLMAEGKRLMAEGKRLWAEGIAAHMPELLALHAELCPDCPWDGETIFPQ